TRRRQSCPRSLAGCAGGPGADLTGDDLSRVRLLHVALNVPDTPIIEHHAERGAVGRQRLLDVLHVLARNADRVAGEIASGSAGGRADGRADRSAYQPDDGADDRAPAGVPPPVIADRNP